MWRRDDFLVIVNISVRTLWGHIIHAIFAFLSIFNFFQTIMVSLFLAGHDQYSIMFKDLNVFEFTNFPFKTKYNSTEYYSVNRNYLFSSIKQEKTIVETILRLNLMCIYKYSVKTRWFLKGVLIHWRSIISLHKKLQKKKQSEAATEMLYKNVVLENFAKFSGKRSCRSLFLILLYRCFPVNIVKF